VKSPLPKRPATGVLRSLRTSRCFSHCPNPGELLAAWASTALAALRRWKVLQFCFTFLAINTPNGLGAVPKTTAPLANLQMHAQFHDCFSVFASSPDGSSCTLLFRGVKRTGHGNSGISCPDGGLPPVFPRFLSCS
jgi:hypothetical protein